MPNENIKENLNVLDYNTVEQFFNKIKEKNKNLFKNSKIKISEDTNNNNDVKNNFTNLNNNNLFESNLINQQNNIKNFNENYKNNFHQMYNKGIDNEKNILNSNDINFLNQNNLIYDNFLLSQINPNLNYLTRCSNNQVNPTFIDYTFNQIPDDVEIKEFLNNTTHEIENKINLQNSNNYDRRNSTNFIKEDKKRKSYINPLKFSTTEIPSIIDEEYLTKRISKTIINSPEEYCLDIKQMSENKNKQFSIRTFKLSNFLEFEKISFNKISKQIIIAFTGILIIIIIFNIRNKIYSKILKFFEKDNENFFDETKFFLLLVVGIVVVIGIIFFLVKSYQEKCRILQLEAENIYKEILIRLQNEYKKENKEPEINIDLYCEEYCCKNNIKKSQFNKILDYLDKILFKKDSEIFKLKLYLENNKKKSFWKLKIIQK